MSAPRRAVFLDRDGVLNRAVVRAGRPYPPVTSTELEILPGVAEALSELKNANFVLIVVSNQPDVARGTTSREAVEEINSALAKTLPIDRFIMCYHDDDENCACRKPRPGSLLSGAKEFGIDLGASFMVGDRWRDIVAGSAAGCKTVFIDYGYDEKRPDHYDYRVASLAEWVSILLREQERQ